MKPDFLWQTEDHWPRREVGGVVEDDKEVIAPKANQNTITMAIGSPLDELLKKFSSWPKLVQSVAWLMHFVHFVKSKRSVPHQTLARSP